MGEIATTTTATPGVDSNTIIEVTTDSGVEIKRIETQWAKVVTPGTVLTAAVYQIVSRVTVESTWEPYYFVDGASLATLSIVSTQLNSRKTTTETLSGVPASVSYAGYQDWVQGGRFTEATAKLRTVEILDEVFTWNADCSPRTSLIERRQWYSPLAATGSVYPDGTTRADTAYLFNAGSIISYPTDYISSGQAASNSRWIDLTEWPTDWYLTSWGALFRVPESTVLSAEAQGVGRLTSYRLVQVVPGTESFGQPTAAATAAAISPMAALTQPQSGSGSVPQVSEEIMMAELDATAASGYQKRTEAPALLPYPENVEELLAIATRRLRRDFSTTLDIPHNCIPYLRVGDHVSVTNHARSLVDADAYVVAIKRTAAVLNGAMRQVTTVKIPPSWI